MKKTKKKKGRIAASRKTTKPRKAPRKTATPRRTKDGGQPGWPTLSPYMTVRDAAKSLAFYRDAFGFAVHGTVMKDDRGQVMHAGMRLGAAAIMFAPQNTPNGMKPPADTGAADSLSLYVYVPDVDRLAERAARGGATVLAKPADQFWGDRIAIFKDPDGYHWTFATNVGAFDASKAPKH